MKHAGVFMGTGDHILNCKWSMQVSLWELVTIFWTVSEAYRCLYGNWWPYFEL